MRILLIDDNETFAEHVREMVAAGGTEQVSMDWAKCLDMGLKRLGRGGVDVVLCDLSLTDSTGMNTVLRVREKAPAVPIVVLTMFDDDAFAVEAVRSGAQDYLVKSRIDSHLLIRALRYALERKQTEVRLERQRERQAILHDINRAITASLDLGGMLSALVDQLQSHFPGVHPAVRLLERESAEILGLGDRDAKDEDRPRVAIARARGLTKFVAQSRQALIVNDLNNDERAVRPEVIRRYGYRSYMGVPIVSGTRLFGILNLLAEKTNYFTQDDVEFFSTVAGEAAIAIENGLLYEQVRAAQRRESILRQINSAISSTLDLDKVLNILVDQVVEFFPRFAPVVRLLDKDSGKLLPITCRNLDEEHWKASTPQFGGDKELFVMTAKDVVVITDLRIDLRARFPYFIRANQLVSYLGVPLFVTGNFVGSLGVFTRELHHFCEGEINLFRDLGIQAAMAIHNSQVYKQLAAKTDELGALFDVASAANETLDLSALLGEVVKKIGDIFRFTATRIFVFEPRGEELFLRANFQGESESLEAAAHFKKGEGITGIVGATGKSIIIADIESDPRYQRLSRSKITGKSGRRFIAGFPINYQDGVLGVLMCVGIEARQLTNHEIRLINSMSNQIGVSLANSQLYERVKRARDSLQKALEVKSALAGVMAHELKTPIQVISGAAQILAEGMCGKLNEAQTERVKTIENATGELAQLIDSALDMARWEHGNMPLTITRFSVARFLRELEEEFAGLFRAKGIEIGIHLLPADRRITSDRIRLKEVFRNLLDNARKYTLSGKVEVVAMDRGDGFLDVIITDTGIGIEADAMPKIFDPFYRDQTAGELDKQGVGLGLSIVKQLVDRLGGEITVQSAIGSGTTFHVRFPMVTQQEAADCQVSLKP